MIIISQKCAKMREKNHTQRFVYQFVVCGSGGDAGKPQNPNPLQSQHIKATF
jgi:hypothetical protein